MGLTLRKINNSDIVNGTFEIPNSVTTIGYRAFYNCTNLESITIPESVTEIGAFAFENCNSLKSITIPKSITKIGFAAFYNCKNLKTAIIESKNTVIVKHAFPEYTEIIYKAK